MVIQPETEDELYRLFSTMLSEDGEKTIYELANGSKSLGSLSEKTGVSLDKTKSLLDNLKPILNEGVVQIVAEEKEETIYGINSSKLKNYLELFGVRVQKYRTLLEELTSGHK